MTTPTRQHWRVVGGAVAGLCAGLVIVLLLTLVAKTSNVTSAIRAAQQTNTQVNTTNHQLLQIIHSCLTPGQPCFEAAKVQRAQTAANSRRVVVAAVACAATLPEVTVATVTRCVTHDLSETRKP